MTLEHIEITDHIAASIRFETVAPPEKFQMADLDLDPDVQGIDDGDLRRDLTARDRALVLMVCAISAEPDAVVEGDQVYVPDLPLRQLLGMRTERGSWEDARLDRFARSTIIADETIPDLEGGVPVPKMTRGYRRRPVKGHYAWDVDEGIRRAFRIEPGDTVVELPTAILARARSRYTLTVALRVLAWGSGYHPTKWLRWQKPDHRVLRIPLADLRADLAIADDVKPNDIMRKVIGPAVAEIQQLTNIAVDAVAWHGPSLTKGKVGRLMGIDIVVPENGRVVPMPDRPSAEILPMQGFAGWVPPGSDATDEDIAF